MDLPPVPLETVSLGSQNCKGGSSYVAAGEVSTLKHEVRDDAVERGALVAEALLASAESTEVLSGLGDDVIKQVEGDATGLGCTDVWLATVQCK